MFVVMFILPESSSVVISRRLAALGKAEDRLVIAQGIVLDLQDEGQAILQDELQLQSYLTPTSTHPTGHVICLGQSEASILTNQRPVFRPIRGQYSGQSEARHNQIRYRKTSRRADGGELFCIKKWF